jgi:hypothetical protein
LALVWSLGVIYRINSNGIGISRRLCPLKGERFTVRAEIRGGCAILGIDGLGSTLYIFASNEGSKSIKEKGG